MENKQKIDRIIYCSIPYKWYLSRSLVNVFLNEFTLGPQATAVIVATHKPNSDKCASYDDNEGEVDSDNVNNTPFILSEMQNTHM